MIPVLKPLEVVDDRKYEEMEVVLNGTDVNPFEQFGLLYNPVAQSNVYWRQALAIQKLAGNPIPDTNYIRRVLDGCSHELIELCCQRFVKGKTVRFTVRYLE